MNEIQARLKRLSPSEQECANAAYNTFRKQGVRCLSELAAVAADTTASPNIRYQAGWLLAELGPKKRAGELLLTLLQSSESSTRAIAAHYLGSLGYKGALSALVQTASEDVDSKTRENAVSGLRLHHLSRNDHDDECFRALLQIAQNIDEAPSVRGLAIEALVDFARPEAVDTLIEALDSPSALIRFWAIYALAEHEAHEVVARLAQISNTDFEHVDGKWSVAEEAKWAIYRLRTGEWPQELWDRLK